MNASISRLFEISGKTKKTIIGVMSGTSIDGLDIALCDFTGSGMNTSGNLRYFKSIPYSESEKKVLLHLATSREVDVEELCIRHKWLGDYIADKIKECMQEWNVLNVDVDLIASHGQTIRHAPRRIHNKSNLPDATLQIGDGDQIAFKTGIITISDFRMKHIAAGGEGAPLAGYGDYLLFRRSGKNQILLNIGGVANLTWLNGDIDNSSPLTFDTGPGNTLIDVVCRNYFGLPYDNGGYLASSGKINEKLLVELLNHPYLMMDPPKTTGPEVFSFNWLSGYIRPAMANEDLLATITAFTAKSIAFSIHQYVKPPVGTSIYVSGGGVHNKFLMNQLKLAATGLSVLSMSELGLNPDAKEAMLFAALANEAIAGVGFQLNGCHVNFGKISMPY